MNKYYFKEIDGLRAIAVIAVIINHFNKDILPSGYLGVDIFFVISGYVITSSLSSKKTVSFFDFITSFYSRRLKRLIPSLLFCLLISVFFILLVDPNPQLSLRTSFFSLFGLSNIYLYHQSTDYFGKIAELNVMNHTWSLGVEEQFYFLFPLLVWFSEFNKSSKNSSKKLVLYCSFISFISLGSFIYFYQSNQPAAYFLISSRFWELALGGILFASSTFKKYLFLIFKNLKPEIILSIIFIIFFLPNRFGAYTTVGIVFLTCALIFKLNKRGFLYNILTKKNFIKIGLISYPLYLWHWPILVISRWTIGIHWWSIPFQVLLIYYFSIFTYKFIEIPIRGNNRFLSKIKIYFLSITSIFSIGTCLFLIEKNLLNSFFIAKNNYPLENIYNFKGKFTKRIAKNCHTSSDPREDALNKELSLTEKFIKDCHYNKYYNKKLFAFVGDSHTLALQPLIDKFAEEYQVNIFTHSRSGCAFPSQGKTTRNGCFEVSNSVNDFILDEFKKQNSNILVLYSYLSSHFVEGGKHSKQFLKYSDGSSNSIKRNLDDYLNRLQILANNLKETDSKLVLIAPLPQFKEYVPELCLPNNLKPLWSIKDKCKKENKKFLLNERENIMNNLNKLKERNENIFIYDGFNNFCDEYYCYPWFKDNLYFYDIHHLSKEANYIIYKDFIKFIYKNNLI